MTGITIVDIPSKNSSCLTVRLTILFLIYGVTKPEQLHRLGFLRNSLFVHSAIFWVGDLKAELQIFIHFT